MHKSGIPIGKIFGIKVNLHTSWFIIFFLITWTLAAIYFPASFEHWSQAMTIGAGVLTSLLYFGSILIHELSHSLVAIRKGIPIKSITLFFLGGASEMGEEPKNARDELLMSAAGPLSSLLLGIIFLGLHFIFRGQPYLAYEFISGTSLYLGFINLFIGVFNLIPAFPLDGGRVLRSLIWWRTKDMQKATKTAARIGQGLGNVFIVVGIFLAFTGNVFNGIWLAMIGWFLTNAAINSYSQLVVQDMLKDHVALEIMTQDCAAVPAAIPLDTFVNDILLNSGRRCFPVVSDSKAEGMISLADVKAIDRSEWSTMPVRQAMTPLSEIKSVSPQTDLNTVLKLIVENDVNQIPVIEDGEIIGMIARENLLNFINIRAQLQS
jgi:Zn-dependent protease/CBS domain-containing protein